jgi:hypothetical protein
MIVTKYGLLLLPKIKVKRGARVITYVVVDDATIFLLTIYDKSEMENISNKELKAMIKSLQ